MSTAAPQKTRVTIFVEPARPDTRGMLDYIKSCGIEFTLRSRTLLSDVFHQLSDNKGRQPYPMLLLEDTSNNTESAFTHHFSPTSKDLKRIVKGLS